MSTIPPPDFTATEWRQSKTTERVARVIRDGGDSSGRSLDMPPWGKTLGPALIRNLADLVLALGKNEQ